jgi:GNAT superfamily N-acetyltransferase
MTDLPDLIRRWQAGWGMARGLPPAEERDGALHVLFGRTGRYREIITLNADQDLEAVRGLAARVAVTPRADWLTVLTERPDEVAPVLEEEGLVLAGEPETFMVTDLRDHPWRAAPVPYTAVTSVEGELIEVVLTHHSGEQAARGFMAVRGSDAVAHNIETAPAHRRRGLAASVMSALTREARARGAVTGLLIASAQGRALYSALGWAPRATVLVALGSHG